MDVSIIIVNYKTPKLTLDCISSVLHHTSGIEFEIIVVDNQSDDETQQLLAEKYPSVIWHQMGLNSGFARANNVGMKLAKGAYFLLLNSDTLLIDNVVKTCFEQLASRPDAVAGGANQLFPDLTPRPFYNTFTFERPFWILPPGQFFNKLIEKLIPQKQYEDPQQVDYIAAAFLMVKRSAVEKIGMLDEEFFLYGEDTEWGWRLGKIGKNLIFQNCNFIHLEWGSKPERYNDISSLTYFNRFHHQIQLSNIVWLRKSYGVPRFLLLMLHYWLWIPIFYCMKFVSNIIELKNPFSELENQHKFKQMISVFNKHFWLILLKKPHFYKL